MTGTVSVIIPTHNRSALLCKAVESALAQTYPNVEVIVIDDGSTDDTATVMAQYSGRAAYLVQPNQGVAVARNNGIRAASGEYLTFLDDDDLMLPTKIERQVRLLASRPSADLAYCRYYYMDKDGSFLGKIGVLPEGEVWEPLLCRNFVWVGAPLVRRQCLEQVGAFDEHIPATCADWDMWLRIARAGHPFACVQEPLGAYRVQPGSMLANVDELEHGVLAVLHKAFAGLRGQAGAPDVKARAYGTWRFWISCRYYAAGRWDAAQRNLAQALTVYPAILENRVEFLDALCSEAFDARVEDPLQFIDDVLDHLPPATCASIRPIRPYLVGRIHMEQALRDYGCGDIAAARHRLSAAAAAYPPMLEQPKDFARILSAHAMNLPAAPHQYVTTVLHNLPPETQRLKRVQSRVLSDVNIACAFEDYFAGRQRMAARRVLSALRHRPSWLRNRGVVSVLIRSLPKLLIGERTTA